MERGKVKILDLEAAIKAFIKKAPSFEGDKELATDIAKKLYEVERIIHDINNV